MVKAIGGRVMLGVDLGKRQTPATIVAVEQQLDDRVWDAVRHCWRPGLGRDVLVVRWVSDSATEKVSSAERLDSSGR